MLCPRCDAENGPIAEVEARGHCCTSCGTSSDPSWWDRVERGLKFEHEVDGYRLERRVHVDDVMTELDAERVDTGRRITLRVYRPWLTRNADFVAQFEHAARWQAQLDARVVRRVDGAGRAASGHYVALEPTGVPVLASMRGTRFAVPDVLRFVRDLCGLYASAHRLGLVLGVHPEMLHVRSSRPLDASGDPYRSAVPLPLRLELDALDVFGHALARPWTIPGAAMETVSSPRQVEYVAPEQLAGNLTEPRSDLYGLGVLLYELLVGHLPYAEAGDELAVFTAQLMRAPRSIADVVEDAPLGIDVVVSRCIARSLRDRFANVEALAAALDHLGR